jgi:hypothetical protein
VLATLMSMLVGSFFLTCPAMASDMSNFELKQELEAAKKRLERLETQLKERPADRQAAGEVHEGSSIGVKGLADRVRRVEQQLKDKPLFGAWADRLTFNGVIEAEAAYEDIDFDDPGQEDEDSSDIALATVELGIDADIAKHVGGHVLFLWEEDDTEEVVVDEGFIILDGEDVLPMYLNAGKMYVPFGYFESHFISDPLTLELGETRESAVKVGFANDMFDLCLTGFNGDIDETGDDDHIKGYVGSATFTLPEKTLPDLGLMAGVSYISNIADSDGLEGETTGEVDDYVGGLGSFVSVSYLERFFVEAEYVGALDSFEAGELSFDGGEELEPKTWNIELAVVPVEQLELALRYEGGDDLGDLLPETQYGAAVTYSLFENTALAVEYLHGEFENDDERDAVTAQLAVEF